MKRISTIIPCHNRKPITVKCISKLLNIEKNGFNHQIYLVDDGSTDGTSSEVKKQFQDQICLIKGDGSLFWTGAINLGVKKALEDGCNFIHLMNDDIDFKNDFLSRLLETALKTRNTIAGSITCDMVNRNTVVKGGVFLQKRIKVPFQEMSSLSLDNEVFQQAYTVDNLSGRSVLIPVAVFKQTGFFDQKKFPHNFADFDFFFRASDKGYQLVINPESIIFTEIESQFSNRIRRKDRYRDIIDLWFDRNYFGIVTIWHLSRHVREYRAGFFLYNILRHTKWTIFRLFFYRSMRGTGRS